MKSPLTENQEVSAYYGRGDGDGGKFFVFSGDNWYVKCGNKGQKYWTRDSVVQFEHVDTGAFDGK